MNNPFPTTADLARERAATDRDVDDLVTLRALRRIVVQALDLAGMHDRIYHPDRRWSTEDLLEVLADQLSNIDAEAARIRANPGVLEEAL